ncbi:MAG: hypothetical protein EON54_22040 [Alcaligenaceae bacterium]|nr:MAG: hypothetical protein EON54_22040 [Alcaligenaceae bacterium]
MNKSIFENVASMRQRKSAACARIQTLLFALACGAHAVPVLAAQPARLETLPAVFVVNDLLTADDRRYTLSAVVSGANVPITGTEIQKNLTALPLASDPSMTQSFFQFDIKDNSDFFHQYSVFIAATQERCALFDITPSYMTRPSWGRVMEIYTLLSQPQLQIVPIRSEPQKICAADEGKLMFNLAAPGPASFEVKIATYRPDGKISNTLDFLIPRYFHWGAKT